ncbi:inositol monophosphatase [Aquabacterium sp. A7-Y]|uniref:inositol monophosphatase family protein n=1 Tax=Aquabacterium sp. A7-Y TaxID=1349605 RepID=UPI00223CC539|nr:inositol monophosphatase [Aquabacterium sp. A7-Y]MCW7539489.1 inositol monophosphatase [Aquabacterium sp. A7-Y]
MSVDRLTQVAVEACKHAGGLLRQSFSLPVQTAVKHDQHNVVTEADLASERLLISHIHQAFPEHSVLAEESGLVMRSASDLWVLDPLDGTSNFAAGLPWFGILLAHLDKGRPDLAVMYLPMSEDLYIAAKGEGATKNGHPITVSEADSLREVLWACGMDSPGEGVQGEEKLLVLRKLLEGARNIRATNCLLDAAFTSEGRIGGMLNWSCRVWDVAAPSLIVQEAGGRYTDIEGNELHFETSLECLEREYAVVAGAPRLHAEVLQLVRDARADVLGRQVGTTPKSR